MAEEKVQETQEEGLIQEILKGEHLSVIGQNLKSIPAFLGEKYGSTKQLDLSYNIINKVENIDLFPKLNSLVLDNNNLGSAQQFPSIPTLQTLWVNNNEIADLKVFLDSVAKSFPNLSYLSMLKNPACPNYFTGKDFDDYQRYRYYVLYRLNKLKFLDSSPVTEEERKESLRVGPYMIIQKPQETQVKKPQTNTDAEIFPELPNDLKQEGKGSARFGMSTYVYYGKHSEGNRFIVNEDL